MPAAKPPRLGPPQAIHGKPSLFLVLFCQKNYENSFFSVFYSIGQVLTIMVQCIM